MTNPADAEREAAWVAAFESWMNTPESQRERLDTREDLERIGFRAGYAAARASAPPAPDAGEREAMREYAEGIRGDPESYSKEIWFADAVLRLLDAVAIAAQAE